MLNHCKKVMTNSTRRRYEWNSLAGVNFINITYSTYSLCFCFFVKLWMAKKAARKMLVKLTPGVDSFYVGTTFLTPLQSFSNAALERSNDAAHLRSTITDVPAFFTSTLLRLLRSGNERTVWRSKFKRKNHIYITTLCAVQSTLWRRSMNVYFDSMRKREKSSVRVLNRFRVSGIRFN